jgi:hypothetical protein
MVLVSAFLSLGGPRLYPLACSDEFVFARPGLKLEWRLQLWQEFLNLYTKVPYIIGTVQRRTCSNTTTLLEHDWF